jgi:lactoylglutathione lyase
MTAAVLYASRMPRSFPVVYVRDVPRAVDFYEGLLDYSQQSCFPPEGEAVFVCLNRDGVELGVVHESSPQQLISQSIGDGPRFELFVYVDDVDQTVGKMQDAGVTVLRPPENMPWGERLAFVEDPDGNPVTLAAAAA